MNEEISIEDSLKELEFVVNILNYLNARFTQRNNIKEYDILYFLNLASSCIETEVSLIRSNINK